MSKKKGGWFITLDGPEGSGKTTQVEKLADYLRNRKYEVVAAREPGSTVIGEKIRQILLDPQNQEMSYHTELFLYLASRVQLVEEIIKPALDAGKIVICDRFTDATVVYQGYAREIGMENVKKITQAALGSFEPDLTVLLDVEAPSGLEKAIKAKAKKEQYSQGDRLEKIGIAFHQKVREGYLKIAQMYPERIKVIKVTGDIEETHRAVCQVVFNNLLDQRE